MPQLNAGVSGGVSQVVRLHRRGGVAGERVYHHLAAPVERDAHEERGCG